MKGAGDRFYFNEETSRLYFPAKELPKVIATERETRFGHKVCCLQIQVLVVSQCCLPV